MLPLDEHAFRHVPQLRGKITDPAHSKFRNLDLSEFDRQAAAAGMPPDWRRSDESREALRLEFLSDRMNDDLWIFGYGSLMWDPGVYFDEVRIAQVPGYQRSFCLSAVTGRGTLERPGLMAALDEGHSCQGIVFRIPGALVAQETKYLWRREMLAFGYHAATLEMETEEGPLEAVTFVANRDGPRYAGGLDIEEAARRIAVAEGWGGSSFDYADKLAAQLELLGLHDADFMRLFERVQQLRAAG